MGSLTSSTPKPLIYLIDDDPEVRDALSLLLGVYCAKILSFISAEHFLQTPIHSDAALLMVELNLPGKSGIELMEQLTDQGYNIPTIIMATHSDVPTAVRAMKAKAIDFIEKPFIHSTVIQQVEQLLPIR